MKGEDVSEDGCDDEDEGFWNSFAISALPIVGLDVEDVDVPVFEVVFELNGSDSTEGLEGCCFDDLVANAETGVLPFTWLEDVAGKVPKNFMASDFMAGVEAGDEDNGAEASSIDPKTTEAETSMR